MKRVIKFRLRISEKYCITDKAEATMGEIGYNRMLGPVVNLRHLADFGFNISDKLASQYCQG